MSDEEEHDAHGHGHGDGHGHAPAPAKKAAPAKGGAKGGSSGGIMGFLGGLVNKVFDFLATRLRRFVAFSMIVFFLGTIFGYFIPTISVKWGVPHLWLLGAPILLAIASYYFTVVAAIIFVLLILVFLLFL